MDFFFQFFGFIGQIVWDFLAVSWWFWLFLILLGLTHSAWFFWRKSIYKDIEWVLLEIKIPREIKKNPKAMEQVLTAIHSLRNTPGTFAEKWLDGEITLWYSLEIVTFGGETHLYVRVYRKQKSLMEAAFLSYYPDIEMVEVEDYVEKFPQSVAEMHEQGYDLWGSEVVLAREAAYPIKTYPEFESPDENKQYDTMSSYFELFSSMKREEIIALQILIAPSDQGWSKKWDHILEKLKRTGEEQAPKMGTTTTFPSSHGLGPLPRFEVSKPTKDEMRLFKTAFRTPGETDLLEAVGRNLSKSAFDTLVRFIYLSPKSIHYDAIPRRGIQGVFNQFSALNMNMLVRNEKTAVGAARVLLFKFPFMFPQRRADLRRARTLYNYIKREIPEDEIIGKLMTSNIFNWNIHSKRFEMNTECLATIFHPPSIMSLTAPHIKRVESRKGGPPAGIAIFGGEENVEKLQ